MASNTKSESGRVNKKLGENAARSVEEILSSVGNENYAEFMAGVFEGSQGAKALGKRFGQAAVSKNLTRPERLELQKTIGNFAMNHAKMNPGIGSEELARLKDEQILLMLKKEFGLVPLKGETSDQGTAA